ncbi:unnamed protein product [Prorocentrum cordatum]|uniref:Uncharacterized protein n=1 Tax=Prorocentrum cordatum TaxID=2364126 RepID=A0ABN9RKB4_9DINO|nr:unnamed protein product [Polarella glacialis]
MRRASYVKTAAFVLVSARAMKLSADGVVKTQSRDTEWVKGISADREAKCSVDNECILGSGLGSCKVMVDPAKAATFVPTLGSTDQTESVESRAEVESGSIIVSGLSNTSHWNLCWKSSSLGLDRRGLRMKGASDYCFYVNGLCFIWASPCSGGCSHLGALSSYSSFCPTLRYATEQEWSSALPILNANRPKFYNLCAASQLDPQWSHCDYGVHDSGNQFARIEDGSWNELILVCGPAEGPGTSGISGPTRSP